MPSCHSKRSISNWVVSQGLLSNYWSILLEKAPNLALDGSIACVALKRSVELRGGSCELANISFSKCVARLLASLFLIESSGQGTYSFVIVKNSYCLAIFVQVLIYPILYRD